jgi:hypothetical protein
MASFLRQLSLKNRDETGTFGNAAMLNEAIEGTSESLVESVEALQTSNAEIRNKYAKLLACGQNAGAIMLTANAKEPLIGGINGRAFPLNELYPYFQTLLPSL